MTCPELELTEALLPRLAVVADRVLGPGTSEPARLAAAVARLSSVYTRERQRVRQIPGDRDALAARLCFFLPRDLPKVAGPLRELAAAGALPPGPRWRVLDVGAGLGATSLGVSAFAAATGAAQSLDVTAVDRDPRALAVFADDLAPRATQAGFTELSVRRQTGDLRDVRPGGGPFDLVVLGLVLNEVEDADPAELASILEGLGARLAPGGSMIVLEPALRTTSRRLHEVRDRIVERQGPLHVWAPCIRGGGCPMLETDRDWCHEELPWSLPPRLAALARRADLRAERLTYSYLTLRLEPGNLRGLFGGGVGGLYRVVSSELLSKGKRELFGCGPAGKPRLMRLDRHATEANVALEGARRGHLLRIEPGHPEGSRLRIGAGTHVERLAPLEGSRDGPDDR